MEQKNEKQPSLLKQLFVFAGNYKYLSILSVFFAGISALAALVPFYCICRIMHEVLRVKPDFSQAEGIFSYGWHTVGFALPGMLFVLLYHHPPTLTTTLMRYAYAGEQQFQLKDAPPSSCTCWLCPECTIPGCAAGSFRGYLSRYPVQTYG